MKCRIPFILRTLISHHFVDEFILLISSNFCLFFCSFIYLFNYLIIFIFYLRIIVFLQVFLLVISNFSMIPGFILCVRTETYVIASLLASAAIASSFYHLCDTDVYCAAGLSFKSLQVRIRTKNCFFSSTFILFLFYFHFYFHLYF